jgi:hypothetical protein
MVSQEKNNTRYWAESWPIESFFKYIQIADPNESGQRDLLEIVFAKLELAEEFIDITDLNNGLRMMAENGLDVNRPVNWVGLEGKTPPNVMLAAVVCHDKIYTRTMDALMDKKPTFVDKGTGYSLLKSALEHRKYDQFHMYYEAGVRCDDPKMLNECLSLIAKDTGIKDIENRRNGLTTFALNVIKMGADITSLEVDGVPIHEVFAKSGYIKVSSTIQKIQMTLNLAHQAPPNLIPQAASNDVRDNIFNRGL